jgi:hypothetical protein
MNRCAETLGSRNQVLSTIRVEKDEFDFVCP